MTLSAPTLLAILVIFSFPTIAEAQTPGQWLLTAFYYGKAGVTATVQAQFEYAATLIAQLMLNLVSLLTGLAGVVLNGVVYHTIVNVSQNYEKISGIDVAWKTIRDIGNMGFIFVLLYAAIQQILGVGSDNKKLIVKIIVVAVLINFSLFFTKVIIDISNLLALTFYEAIVPGVAGKGFESLGLSNAFMQHMDLTSLYKATGGSLTLSSILTVGVMGSVMLLITAFVFFAVALMFIIRYVVLIFVLILSPIAFLSYVLPEMDQYRKQWKDALIHQAFFAPIYFALTWVTVKILAGIMGTEVFGTAGPLSGVGSIAVSSTTASFTDGGFFSTFINFMVVIVFLIVSLVISKEWASKTPGGVGKLTSWAMGAAGGATFGLAARAGRYTLGASAEAFKESKAYKRLEAVSPNNRLARLTLAAADKTRTSSFDVRGAGMGSLLSGAGVNPGQAGGKGGFVAEKVAVEEFFERPGTKSYKERHERSRRAKDELGITENLADAGKFDAVRKEEERLNTRLSALESEERGIRNAITAGTATAGQRIRLADIVAEKTSLATSKADVNSRKSSLEPSVNEFEKAINSATNKEIEAILKTNRDLIESQEFANRISVQQLEAINKSDEFTEDEKKTLKNNRFASFNIGSDGLGALAVPDNIRTIAQKVSAKSASAAIKGLKDQELELIEPELLGKEEFVSTLRPAQVEALNKSNKFTTTQRNTLRDTRRRPLMNAIGAADIDKTKAALRVLGPKEVAALDMAVLKNPIMAQSYSKEILKRMAPEINPADVAGFKDELLKILPSGNDIHKWLISVEGKRFYP